MATTEASPVKIINAAVGVFLRYGFKKTSMEAVASAAGLSRQALYLHFSTKEDLFRAVVGHLIDSTIATAHAALWRDGLGIEDQLLATFEEILLDNSTGTVDELFATAKVLFGDAVSRHDTAVVDELANRLAAEFPRWPSSLPDLRDAAQSLQAASNGFKQQSGSRAVYTAGMRTAIRLLVAAATSTSRTKDRR